ncbi:MAG: hypothetical protein SGARI_001411, partial [Bacillariaceae sp.]
FWTKSRGRPSVKLVGGLYCEFLDTGCPCPSGESFVLKSARDNYFNYGCRCNDINVLRLTRIDEVGKVDGHYLFDIGMKRGDKYRLHSTPDSEKPTYPMTLKEENQFGDVDGDDDDNQDDN